MNPAAIIANFIQLYSVVLLIRCLLTWIPSLDFSTQPFRTLADVTDPYLNLFRGLIPPLGGMDFSPMLAFLALNLLGTFLPAALQSVFAAYSGYLLG
jgi:YggT family protein